MKNFVLLGAAGYVAPRHIQAIKDTGNNLVAICDPSDSVGVIDRHFPDCLYFKDFERLDRHCYKLARSGVSIDYISIASPNYLHDAHCRWGMRMGADVICEKPLVLTEENLDGLLQMEQDSGKHVYGLYQLRYHPGALDFYGAITGKNDRITVNYCTPRGPWYDFSWKGDIGKSGGIETNIGCHLFDLAADVIGPIEDIDLAFSPGFSMGKLYSENGSVMTWRLSLSGKPCRLFTVNGKEIGFDSGFADLHTIVYEEVLAGRGLSIENHRASIRICEQIRAIRQTGKQSQGLEMAS